MYRWAENGPEIVPKPTSVADQAASPASERRERARGVSGAAKRRPHFLRDVPGRQVEHLGGADAIEHWPIWCRQCRRTTTSPARPPPRARRKLPGLPSAGLSPHIVRQARGLRDGAFQQRPVALFDPVD